MTDFIHEHPKDETPAAPPPAPAEETPLDEKTGQKRVYGYILILFVVAFSLLLWSSLMNQRSNEQVISELRGSAGTLQTTLDRNIALENQVDELETKIRELESSLAALKSDNEALERQVVELTLERDAAERQLDDLRAKQDTDGTAVENP